MILHYKNIQYSSFLGKIFILILTAFILFPPQECYADYMNAYSFMIGEFEDGEIAINSLKSKPPHDNFGLSIQLKYDPEEKDLFINSTKRSVSFTEFAETLKERLAKYKDHIFPLFIEYNGPENWLEEAINSSGLKKLSYHLPAGERWPTIEEIRDTDRQLIIFTFFNTHTESGAYNYAWNHIAEFPFTTFKDPIFEGYFTNGDIQNEFLLLRDFTLENIEGSDLPENWVDLNRRTICLDHVLKCWQYSGKRPNFIFYSTHDHAHTIQWLLNLINAYPNISGTASLTGKPLKRIYWHKGFKAITNGYFNFPITEGYEPELSPSRLGYTFSPASIQLTQEDLKSQSINFEASPLELSDALTGQYTFNNEINNLAGSPGKHKNFNCEFTRDVARGDVLKIKDSSYLMVSKVADYGIKNSSFTISIYFKLSELDPSEDYCILGTNESEYRKGLHVNIRQETPYFGFFNSDVSSYERLEALKWYHMVVRYNLQNEEQSIFINGELSGSSENHPSFVGKSELIVGRGILQDNYFRGYVDDLYIWNRALSNEEIKKLHASGLSFDKSREINYLFIAIIVLIILLVFQTLRSLLKKQKRNTRIKTLEKPKLRDTTKNSVMLFGDFRVTDKSGNDISSQFPPKIKELFLLILLYSLRTEKGISVQKITQIIWKGFSTSKASNNRGVSFNKLRKALSYLKGIDIEYDDGYWKIVWNQDFVCDYILASSLLKELHESHPERYFELYTYVQAGSFLEGNHWDWLEEFRSAIVFDIIDALLSYIKLLINAKEPDQANAVSTLILSIDELNEPALNIKLNYLKNKGNSNKAKYLFDKFSNKYFEYYDEKYPINFQQFTDKKAENLG